MLMQNALWLAIAAGGVAVLYGVFMANGASRLSGSG